MTEINTFWIGGKYLFVFVTADGDSVRTQIGYVHPEKGFVFRDSEEDGGGEE